MIALFFYFIITTHKLNAAVFTASIYYFVTVIWKWPTKHFYRKSYTLCVVYIIIGIIPIIELVTPNVFIEIHYVAPELTVSNCNDVQ